MGSTRLELVNEPLQQPALHHDQRRHTCNRPRSCVCVCVSIILRSARWPEESAIYYSACGLSSTQLILYMIYLEGSLLREEKRVREVRNKGGGGVLRTAGREEAGVPAYETNGPANRSSRRELPRRLQKVRPLTAVRKARGAGRTLQT